MLFNSHAFLFVYLPIVFFGFFWIARFGYAAAAAALGVASLAFYAWWDVRYLPLLFGSIVFNFVMGREISRSGRKALLVACIAANLILLGVFKYAGFFVSGINDFSGSSLPVPDLVLPLGISFFTFTQIVFLVDTYKGIAQEYRFSHYLLFVSYFPHLIAGPVLHHKQMMPQFGLPETYRVNWENIAVGLTIFAIGLAKKVLIADSLAPYADGTFDAVHQGRTVMLFEAWIGVLAYAFQLYFDFSGYSDMAIGLARLFNVKLPLNFNSPYKATNLIEFWHRWHMTLSAFLRHYLYLPLRANRESPYRRYASMFATMVLGGLWHGANWTFVLWGMLHGALLVAAHTWRRVCKAWRLRGVGPTWVQHGVAWGLTFFLWVLSLVLFRSESVADAWLLLLSILGESGISLPATVGRIPGVRELIATTFGSVAFDGVAPNSGFGLRGLIVLTVAAAIAFLAPNTQELLAARAPAWDAERLTGGRWLNAWRPNFAWAAAVSGLLVASIISLSRPSPFLYFQF